MLDGFANRSLVGGGGRGGGGWMEGGGKDRESEEGRNEA